MLRPTFLSFETAKRALSVSQMGLDTVGHNISNVKTPGYTRQRLDQVSMSSGGYKAKFQSYGTPFSGLGAEAVAINQIRDPFLDNRYRIEAANYGELAAKGSGLSDVAEVMDEIMSKGLSSKFDDLITQLDRFMEDSSSKEFATVVRNTAMQLTQVLNKSAVDLQNVVTSQKDDLRVTVDEVNNILEQISIYNSRIKDDNFYANPSNELNDERNMLIDQLSQYLNIHVRREPVKVSDSLTVEQIHIELKDVLADGKPMQLVSGGNYNKLGILNGEISDSGNVSLNLLDGVTGLPISQDNSDIGAKLSKGALKGALDVLNGEGIKAENGNTFRGIPYYQNALDDYAKMIAEQFNKINSLKLGEGKPPVTADTEKPLFASSDGSSVIDDISAQNITISSEWLGDPLFITTTKKSDGGAGANDNLLKFKEMLKTPFAYSNTFKGNFQEYIVSVQAENGLDIKLNASMMKASFGIIGGISDERDSVSAVNINEEAINMMTYQNYYNAAARYMTTLDEALGMVIQNMGVVGR